MYGPSLFGGLAFLIIGISCPPVYARIVYLFLARPSFNKMESYRIMGQIGIVQLLLTPAALTIGASHLSPYDIWQCTLYPRQLFSMAMRVEAPLNFVLALNRVQVICNLKYSSMGLLALCYTYGAIFLFMLNSPWCGIIVETWVSYFDPSKPLSALVGKVALMISMGSMWACFTGYVIVLLYLIKKGRSITKRNNFQAERTIFLYAVIHFACDMFLVVGLYYITLPGESWITILMSVCYLLNYLVLPPVLYMAMYPSVRQEFFRFSKTEVVFVQTVTNAHLTMKSKQ
uniref:Serpentine Receptor, class T n=1 Tax=Steinernema glaseri TaxID=37863 RepID=A0A1I7YTM5_9BILA